jgi:predicted Rossmann fold nucleotide-binding protein DprA/Smf involved in DNA uptake
VPGSILALSSLGCNHLIRDGAYVLLDADDILWRLPAGSLQTRIERWLKQGGAADAPGLPADESDGPVERQVLQRLAGGDQSLAELAVQLGRSLESMAVVLTGMELAGDLSYRRGRYTLTENALCSI